jgi:hypothetical protein
MLEAIYSALLQSKPARIEEYYIIKYYQWRLTVMNLEWELTQVIPESDRATFLDIFNHRLSPDAPNIRPAQAYTPIDPVQEKPNPWHNYTNLTSSPKYPNPESPSSLPNPSLYPGPCPKPDIDEINLYLMAMATTEYE